MSAAGPKTAAETRPTLPPLPENLHQLSAEELRALLADVHAALVTMHALLENTRAALKQIAYSMSSLVLLHLEGKPEEVTAQLELLCSRHVIDRRSGVAH